MAEIVVKLVNGELAGQTAQTIAKNVNEATLALKKAEIGTKAWVDAAAKLDKAKQVQADYKTQLDSTSKASDALKQSFGGILNQIPGFSQISGAMRSASSGVGGLTSGFGLLKGAIAATGIGLLVIAVSTLVMWFSKTEAGANVLGGVMRGLGAVVNVLFGKMMEIGKALYAAFQNPKQLLLDLVDFIGNNLLNRLKSFVVIWEGIKNLDLKKVTDGFIQMGTGITDATDKMMAFGKEVAAAAAEGYDFVQIMDDIEDRQAAMEVSAKKADILVDQLLLQAKNIGKTHEERIALLTKANDITEKSYTDQLKLSKEYLDAVNKEIDAEKKQQGVADDTDEQRDKRKDAELAYLNLLGQETQVKEKIANRSAQIFEQDAKLAEKAAAAKRKQLDDEEKAEENILQLRAENQAEGVQKEIDGINASTDAKIKALVGSQVQIDEQRILLEEVSLRQIQAVRDKYAKEELDKQKKLKKDEDELEKKHKDLIRSVENEKAAIAEQGLADTIGLLSVDESARKKNADAIKAFTIGQMGISLQNEIQGIWENAEKNPVNALFPGSANIIAAIKTALAVARFAGGVGRINSQKFALGGTVLHGPSHAQGGIPIEAEGNEIILTKGVYFNPALRSMASRINVAAGGRSFETGGPTNPFDQSRGPIASGNAQSGDIFDYERLSALIDQKMENKIMNIQVHNNVQDTAKGIQVINGIKDEANA